MEKKETIFTDGLVIRMPSEKAPDYILLKVAVKAHKFFQWCQNHQDEKGWVNITIKRSQKGTIYADLDTWKPEKKDEYESQADKQFEQIASQEVDTSRVSHDPETNQDIALDDIPF